MTATARDERARIGLGLIPDLKHYSVENNLRELCRLAEEAGKKGCDLVCFEEVALGLFAGKDRCAVRLDGPEVGALAAIARRRRMYVAVGLIEERGRRRHNSVVLIDRRGRVAGVHRKLQLTNGEIQGGQTPGDRIDVFEADFGRIGFIICYDSQFPEIARTLAVKGADLIVCPHVGGAVWGDLTARALSSENTVWSALVGRYCTCVVDPRAHTVAMTKEAGKLLVVDCALRRTMLSVNPIVGILSWRTHQRLERRPDVYGDLLGPPVAVESPLWPLYMDNELRTGPGHLEFALVNRSGRRQRGSLEAAFPAPVHILTDEHVAWFVDRVVGERSWDPKPARFRFDLRPGERREYAVEFNVPDDEEGYFLVRLAGRTANGDAVLWERRLQRFVDPPALRVPRLKRGEDPALRGARVPLECQFMGGRAVSRTEARIARDDAHLLLHVACLPYGPWQDEPPPSPDGVEAVLMPDPAGSVLYRCTVSRTGERSTQVREGGHPVNVAPPKWTARIERGRQRWTALLRLPFREFGGPPAAGARWRFNLQRAAVLPDAVNAARALAVVHDPAPKDGARAKNAVEWAVWSVPYSRVDAVERLGWLDFD